jgi:hypothetical protein
MSTLNRFFFWCPSCFFKFTADAEGLKAPEVGGCPVCDASWVKCLGATRGVLKWDVPCNDKCVFAEGPDCSCSCGGHNHGSRLLVPVVGNVVEFSGKLPVLEVARLRWEKWKRTQGELVAVAVPADPKAARAWLSMMSKVRGTSQFSPDTWKGREKLVASMRALVAPAAPGPSSPAVGAAAVLLGASSFIQSRLLF